MVSMVNPTISTTIATRWRVRVTGVVQGVGFRPFVYRLACAMHFTGWICNDPQGVTIEVQGFALTDFLNKLSKEAPPLASIDQVSYETIPAQTGERHFQKSYPASKDKVKLTFHRIKRFAMLVCKNCCIPTAGFMNIHLLIAVTVGHDTH